MKKLFFLLFITFFSINNFAQYQVEWSPLQKTNGYLAAILPIQGTDFFAVRAQGSMLRSSYYLFNHSNMQTTFKGKVMPKVETGMASIESYTLLNNTPVVFLSDKADGKNTLYVQKYNGECQAYGPAIEVSSYEMPKGWKNKGYFNVIQSQNEEFICVIYEVPGSKTESERFGYKVMDNELNTISEGEYESPYDPNISSFSNQYLSNTGDFFVGCKIYATNSKGKVKDRTMLEKMLIFHITPSNMEEFELKTGSKRITDVTFSSDNNRILTVTGLYGEDRVGTKGVFYMRLNFDSKTVINEGFEEFSKDFITEGWSDRAKEKADKREAKGKGAPMLYNYDVRDIITLKDGSFIGIIEQYYVRVVTTTDSRGYTRTTYYYYYNDIIAYKVLPNGSYAWLKKIPKYQVSTNDGGYLSSFAHFYTDDKLAIMFNDNTRNYDESGNWNKSVSPTSYRKKTNCVSLTELDLNTGEMTRKTFFDRAETEAIAIPKLFATSYINKEMMLYLRFGRKEKFGLLRF